MWAKKWLLGRDGFTLFNLLNFIINDSPEDYKNYLRMTDEKVQYLIAKVKPLIAKQGTTLALSLFVALWICELAWDLPHTYEPITSRRRIEPHRRP